LARSPFRAVELVGSDGERIPAEVTSPDDDSVIVSFDALTMTGSYQLRWFAQANDDHPITGAATFSVDEDTDPSNRMRPHFIILAVLGPRFLAAPAAP